MDSDKYLEGQSMQRPPLFESDHFIYWKNRFETYVKAKDLDLWHIILNGDFPPVAKNEVTQILEVVPFEEQSDDLKKKLAKNNEAKMAAVIYSTRDSQVVSEPLRFFSTPIFGDDETIAKVLLNMSQAKAVSREKEKGVELKDIEETDRPRPTSTRSLLTLKPLLKIDLKDKGKKKIEEEDGSESESDGIPEAEKNLNSFKLMKRWLGKYKKSGKVDRLLAEKLQEEEREQFTIEERAKFLHDTIDAQRKFLA
ncbi:hypothetical protein Tco_0844582 [Tanacetum coccineum]